MGAWRNAFIGVNAGVNNGLGLLSDTFETAITWDRWPEFDAAVRARVRPVLDEVLGTGASLSCRFTHVYPDGPAPYYSWNGPAAPGGEFEQWAIVKDAAMAAVVDAGGTVTHHHAVGRMHRPGWDRQRPELFAEVLKAAKRRLDPERDSQSGRADRPLTPACRRGSSSCSGSSAPPPWRGRTTALSPSTATVSPCSAS